MARPGQSAGTRRWQFYAQLCELFERPQEAQAVYERLLKRRPHDANARVHLARLVLENDPHQAVQHLLAVPSRDRDWVGQVLVESCERRVRERDQAEALLMLAELVAGYVQGLADPNRSDLQWVDQVREHLVVSMRVDRRRLGPLYSPIVLRDDMDEQMEPLENERRRVHNALCRSMLGVPQLVEQGFAGLHAEARSRGALTDEFVGLAYQAWSLAQTDPSRWATSTDYRSRGSRRAAPSTRPINYLLHDAWQKGTLPDCVHRLKQAVPEQRRVAAAQQIDAMARLYRVPGTQFRQAADAFVNQRGTTTRVTTQLPLPTRDLREDLVRDVWEARAFEIELDKLFQDYLPESFSTGFPSAAPVSPQK